MPYHAAILTTSDAGAKGEREDTSGAAIRELLQTVAIDVTQYEIVPDDAEIIAATLERWVEMGDVQLIVTTGGTGLGPRDVTPNATTRILDYEVPGIAEAMRAEGLRYTPMSMISRAVAGVRGKVLIINLPGSPKGVRENLSVVLPVLQHALDLLTGVRGEHS